MSEEIDWNDFATFKTLVRTGDPETSYVAACKAMDYSAEAQRIVATLMDDGVARIDEEIDLSLKAQGIAGTDTAFRKGRLALELWCFLIPTGKSRKTLKGRSPSREWIKSPAFPSILSVLEPILQGRAKRSQISTELKKAARREAREVVKAAAKAAKDAVKAEKAAAKAAAKAEKAEKAPPVQLELLTDTVVVH